MDERPAVIPEKTIRQSLRLSVVFNLGAAWLLVFPDNALGHWAGFAASSSPLHTGVAAMMVVALGLAYAWLAQQPVIDRPLLALGGLIKGAAYLLFVGQWLFGVLSGHFVLFATADIVLAILWLGWLYQTRR